MWELSSVFFFSGVFFGVAVFQVNPMWSKDKKSHYIEHATREYEIHKELHHTNVTEL